MKRILLLVLSVLVMAASGYSMTAKEKLNDAMGRAYKAASEKNKEAAKDWFRKGAQYAVEANSWTGLIDSGYGLSTLGLPEEAKSAFDNASKIVMQEKDWHGAVAIGYAYASLPKTLGTTDLAVQLWSNAKGWALNSGDWAGLIESGRGFLSVAKNKEAEGCFDQANSIIKDFPTEQSIKAIVNAYKAVGNEQKAMECSQYKISSSSAPPPGWVPTVGESVRSAKTVSPEVQQAQRASIDQDIAAKRQMEAQEEQLKYEEKMQKQQLAYQAYRDYLYYYSYPYYGSYSGIIGNYDDYYFCAWTTQPVWTYRTDDEIYNWGMWNCGRYNYVNGFYVEVNID